MLCISCFCIMWSRLSLNGWSKVWKTTSTEFGLTLGWKLKVFSGGAPIHSATYLKSAKLELRQNSLHPPLVSLLINLILLMTTSRVELPSVRRCRLSITNSLTSFDPFLLFHFLLRTSKAWAVVTMRSAAANIWASFVRSSKVLATFFFEKRRVNSCVFFWTITSCETNKIAFLPCWRIWLIAKTARLNFPAPSEAPKKMLSLELTIDG